MLINNPITNPPYNVVNSGFIICGFVIRVIPKLSTSPYSILPWSTEEYLTTVLSGSQVSNNYLLKEPKLFFLYIIITALKAFIKHLNPVTGSFYTISSKKFLQQWSLWNQGLPGITPYYAVKCNPEPMLLKWISDYGGRFDCASSREMYLVKDALGEYYTKDKILFANPCKTPNDVEAGKDLQVSLVTADSCEELLKMDSMGYKTSVLLRVAADDMTSSSPFAMKFGLSPSKVGEVAYLAKRLKIPVLGLSFHVGSGSKNPLAFKNAITICKNVWSNLRKNELADSFKILDLGGGWSPEKDAFLESAKHAKEALQQGEKVERVIAEPGRFFAAPTHSLYVRVVGKKLTVDNQGWRYTLDESIYGQFSCVPFDHATPQIARVILNKDNTSRLGAKALFFGRTCDSLDIIAKSRFTEELFVGDWLHVPSMGAYTTATSTEFNGFPKPDSYKDLDDPLEDELKWLSNIEFPLGGMLDVEKACSI